MLEISDSLAEEENRQSNRSISLSAEQRQQVSDSQKYPRVLIVGHNFDSSSGGGITLSNLFRGWPKDRLAAAAARENFSDATVCERNYRLGSREDYWIWPLSYIPREGKVSGPVQVCQNTSPLAEATSIATRDGSSRVARKLFYRSINLWGGGDLLHGLWVSLQFLAWIRDFRPDVIYTQLSTFPLIRLIAQVIRLTGVPLVIHMMDDWPSTIYRHGLLSPYMRWRTNREFRALLRLAFVRMAISHKMAQAFNDRYGCSFLIFHNAIETNRWLRFAKRSWEPGDPLRLVYTGRIGTANLSSLRDVCLAVEKLSTEGFHVRFDLYTKDCDGEMGRRFKAMEGVLVHAPVPYEDVPAVLGKADLLILPLDFEDDSVRFARYSLPTKTPEYMISGVPVLVYAPGDVAASEYARQEGWGFVVTERNLERVKEAIVRLGNDQPLREQLGQRAQELAIQNHDAAHVREAFRATLAEAAMGETTRRRFSSKS